MNSRGALFGLLAAALFGLSAPVAKLLLPASSPLQLAALLYLGGGAGLTIWRWVSRLRRRAQSEATAEAPLRWSDAPMLLAIVVLGGVAGPVLMLWGLVRLSGLATSLLLNLEGSFTILIAVVVFREHLGRRALLASLSIFGGAVLLATPEGRLSGDLLGALAIAGACAAWALDNNLTQRLSLKDPLRLVQLKTLGAGAGMLVIAMSAFGERIPGARVLASALMLGALSYGVSILLDAYALRLVGAAREAAFFATAPFIGAAVSIPLLGDRPTWIHLASALLMTGGVGLLVREKHSHVHTHEALQHEHLHVHDEHHQHAHEGPVSEPHSHPHQHERLTHEHPHAPDLHHRHPHD